MKGQLEYEGPHTKDVCSKLKEEGVPQILWKEGRLHGSDDDDDKGGDAATTMQISFLYGS